MIRSILVTYDGSLPARETLEDALVVARREHSTLTILSVVAPVSTFVLAGGAGPTAIVAAEAQREATLALHALSEWMPADVPYTTLLRFGRPAAQIRALLAERPFDVVFIGSERRRRFRRSPAQRFAGEVRLAPSAG